MINVKSVVLEQKTEKFWGDCNLSITNKKVLNLYTKGNFDIELVENLGFFVGKEEDVMNYKTTIKISQGGNLIKRKLFYMGYDKWNGFNHEMLVNEVFKTIN